MKALINCDAYKLGHAEQYPPGTTKVYSNLTPRSTKLFNVPAEYNDGKIVWFGLQGFLNELEETWNETFFKKDIDAIVLQFARFIEPFGGDGAKWGVRLRELHKAGFLPLEIKALREGSLVPAGIPVLTITNTLPEFYWLPNFLETYLSAELWKASTSATTARVYRRILDKYAIKTGASLAFVDWQAHDFSVRGMSGIADAAKSGAGHLLYFTGTDNLPAVQYVMDNYYGQNTFVGGSVPASEHAIMSAGGKESELETFRRLLATYPTGVISIVSDTWDFWRVITEYTVQLKDTIMNRQKNVQGLAKTVFRPDSEDPVKVICGNPDAPEGSPERKGAVQCLWEVFGGTVNTKGYKTLDEHVGLIYGDSITPARAEQILATLAENGFASDNIVFGVGSFTYQYCTRDTLGFAMKATYVEIDGQGMAIAKAPRGDSGKASASGLLRVKKDESGTYFLEQNCESASGGLLVPVYEGYRGVLSSTGLESMRDRVRAQQRTLDVLEAARDIMSEDEELLLKLKD